MHEPPKRDLPDGLDLLAEVREVLKNLSASAAPEQRLILLMAASAIGMAEREWRHEDDLAATNDALLVETGARNLTQLCTSIREGRHDANAAIHQRLDAYSLVRLQISKPRRAAPGDNKAS
jgi:hypothetical protein